MDKLEKDKNRLKFLAQQFFKVNFSWFVMFGIMFGKCICWPVILSFGSNFFVSLSSIGHMNMQLHALQY